MERRQFLAVAGSVAVAGCVGVTIQNSAGEDTEGSEHSLDGAPATDAPVSDTTSDDAASTPTPAAELEIFSTVSGSVDAGFQLQLYDGLRTVHERTRELDYGERAYLSGRLAEDTDYLFDLSVDGSLLVERPIYAGERVVLEIADRHTVRLVERRLL